MDFLENTKKLAVNCYFVVWKDPTEGDGKWKDEWDGKASTIMNVGWMELNPNANGEFVLYSSKDFDPEITEKGSEIYIPKGCIIVRYPCSVVEQGEYFEPTTTIK